MGGGPTAARGPSRRSAQRRRMSALRSIASSFAVRAGDLYFLRVELTRPALGASHAVDPKENKMYTDHMQSGYVRC